ncbi:MAG TPA: hypothetical protein PKX91_01500 [Clostridia bacterium]|nr:hypothetical protein [Clostridia bacterium]
MFNLTRDDFKKYIQTAGLKMVHKDTKICIESAFDYSFDDYPPTAYFVGYMVDGEQLFENIESLFAFLGNPTEFTVSSINGFTKLEDYLFHKELETATMEFILKSFGECNKFSLVIGFKPDFYMSPTQASTVYSELVESDTARLKKVYEKVKEEYNLDSFETIKANITNECKAFKSKYFKKYKRMGFSNCFIADHVGDDTMYSEPHDLFWEFYFSYGYHLDVKEELDKLMLVKKNNKIMEQLDRYPELKNNFLDYQITYKTYATEGPLAIIYYFKLNEETRQFLLKFKDDFSMDIPFEDLALYQEDKLVYASCTHEQFRYNKLAEIERW